MKLTIAVLIVFTSWTGAYDPAVAGETPSQFSKFDVEILDVAFQKNIVGGDRCLLGGQLRLGTESDGVRLLWEDMTIAIGDYSLTVPAGSFDCAGVEYKWHGKIDGAVVGILLEERDLDHFSFAVAVGSIDLGEISGRTRISLAIGDDEGSFTAGLAGRLQLDR